MINILPYFFTPYMNSWSYNENSNRSCNDDSSSLIFFINDDTSDMDLILRTDMYV